MKILALEFSSDRRSVAVLAPGREPVETHARGHQGATPLELVDDALRQAGCERADIGCLAVGAGPGSYAGIRVAIAMAQGWSLAQPVKLCAISSADCVAAAARAEGMRGVINVVLDAQRGEFYLGRYELTDSAWRVLEPLHITSRLEVLRHADCNEPGIGPAAAEFNGEFLRYPAAFWIGTLAVELGKFVTAAELEPIYLRPVAFIKAPPSRTIPPAA